jgi:hypothetical protein
MTRKQSETAELRLRFPEKLRLRIESAASRNQRSMNAEIIHRLEQSFQRHDQLGHDQLVLAKAAATAVIDEMQIVPLPDGKFELRARPK